MSSKTMYLNLNVIHQVVMMNMLRSLHMAESDMNDDQTTSNEYYEDRSFVKHV